ncbi:MAG: hypothetical protein HOV94_16220 [Saccharothrix sp.]|nr:hypothetical protein [Saccharothrix sp.]
MRAEPVVTIEDATATAVAAAVLAALRRAGRPPHDSRVVIVGADHLPLLCLVLIATGVGDIATCNTDDAAVFPLHGITEHADVLVDLMDLGGPASPAGPVVVTRDTLDPMLVLPGLLHATDGVPVVGLDLAVHQACATALATVISPGRHRRPEAEYPIIALVADTAIRALRRCHPVAPPREGEVAR